MERKEVLSTPSDKNTIKMKANSSYSTFEGCQIPAEGSPDYYEVNI